MPITVKHTPVGTLGRLALAAGKARGREIVMSRDIQLTGMVLAAEGRSAAIGLAAQDRTFALQQVGAAQIARERPTTPDTLKQRKDLRRAVAEAKAAGIFPTAQIKQMEILADLGDEKAVSSLLKNIPQPTLRRRELQSQAAAIEEIRRGDADEIQQQIDKINQQLETRFTPGTLQLFRERPKFLATAPSEVQEALAQQQQLEDLKNQINQRAQKVSRMIGLGLTVSEQQAFQTRQEIRQEKQEADEIKREVTRIKGLGELSEKQELSLDLIRDREKDTRRSLDREITRLGKDLAPFENEVDDPKAYADRITPIRAEIQRLNLKKIASHAKEKTDIGEFLGQGQKKKTKQTGVPSEFYTTPDGSRYKFSGEYEDGEPQYDLME